MPRRKEPVTSEFSKKTADFFKEKRIALGYTQADIAELLYGHKKYRYQISDLETGMKQITVWMIDKFCKKFNCDVEFTEKL